MGLGWCQKSNLVPKHNLLLIMLIVCSQFTVLSQPCGPHSEPGSTTNSDMEWGQRPVQNLCNNGPKRNVKLLFIYLLMYQGFIIALFSHCLCHSYWYYSFCILLLEFQKKKMGGEDEGVCMKAVWVLQWVSDSKKEWERCSAFAKKNNFPGLDASVV